MRSLRLSSCGLILAATAACSSNAGTGEGDPGAGADAGTNPNGDPNGQSTFPGGQVVGQTPGDDPICGGELAETTFRFGLCLCEDLAFASALYTDGYRASQGPYAPGRPGGSVGVNGLFRSWGETDIGGSLFAGGDARPIGNHDVRGQLHSGGDVTAAGDIHVFHDAYVSGDVLGIRTKIDGTLHIPAASSVGLATESQRVQNEPVTVAPPCDCDPSGRINIAGFIADARARNDNAAIGLTPDAWTRLLRPIDVVLPPGRYYVDRIETLAPVTLHVSRATALYVGGDLRSGSVFEIVLDDPRGELDMFIGGDIIATGDFELGTRSAPSHVRTYVAGGGDISMAGDLDFGGNLYAPKAKIVAVGPLEVFGSVLARGMIEAGVVKVHFDTDILSAGDSCRSDPPSGTVPPPPPPPRSCSSCLDCRNQACVGGTCGRCQTSADCCAPLVCDSSNGTCAPLSL